MKTKKRLSLALCAKDTKWYQMMMRNISIYSLVKVKLNLPSEQLLFLPTYIPIGYATLNSWKGNHILSVEYLIHLFSRYWKLSLMVHPDKCSHPQAHQAFVLLNQAFKDLQDPDKVFLMHEHCTITFLLYVCVNKGVGGEVLLRKASSKLILYWRGKSYPSISFRFDK